MTTASSDRSSFVAHLLTRLSIPKRLGLLVGLAAIATVGAFAVQLVELRDSLVQERYTAIRNQVQAAISLSQSIVAAQAAGRLSEAQAQDQVKTLVRAIRFDGGNYLFIIAPDGVNLVIGPKPELEGKQRIGDKDINGVPYIKEFILAAQRGGDYVSYQFSRPGQTQVAPKVAYSAPLAPWGWAIGGGVYLDDVNATFIERMKTAAYWAVAIFAIVGLVAWVITRSITRPVRSITSTMANLAEGNTDVDIPVDRRDEIGAMARAVAVFRDRMIESEHLRGDQEKLKLQAEVDKKQLMQRLADDFEHGVSAALTKLSAAAADMNQTSQNLSATAQRSSTQAATVAAAAEQASSNVQSVASASEEMNSSITEIGRRLQDATQITGRAVAQAENTDKNVNELAESARKIGDVVELISSIASQTNLLALNATIEAARAGDAGRGFAVVASEVKNLAEQTSKATGEIGQQIATIQEVTGNSVAAIREISTTIRQISEIATVIAAAVEEQGAATMEISRNVQEAAQGTGQVSQHIIGVNQATGETGVAANHVLTSADELGRQAEMLRGEIDKFLAGVRNAA